MIRFLAIIVLILLCIIVFHLTGSSVFTRKPAIAETIAECHKEKTRHAAFGVPVPAMRSRHEAPGEPYP